MTTRPTASQRIAKLEAQLAKAKDQARKERTRRLIIAGTYFESVLDDWESLPENDRQHLANKMREAITHQAAKRKTEA